LNERRPAPSEKRQRAYGLGLRAESIAALYLRLTGWRILARRYLAPGGEIDVIAMRGGVVAFVEVKARATIDAAAVSITPQKSRRISRAARRWVAQNPWAMRKTLRGDAMLLAPGRWPQRRVGAIELDV
jgi:putative endonuclease